jgi:hypothetical protein
MDVETGQAREVQDLLGQDLSVGHHDDEVRRQVPRRSTAPASLILSVGKRGQPFSIATRLTAEGRGWSPRPAGRSGCVTTQVTWEGDRSKERREGTAKSDVPMKTTRKGSSKRHTSFVEWG